MGTRLRRARRLTRLVRSQPLPRMERLYIAVRSDLPPGLQMAQACHAAREFAARYPALDAAWHQGHNNLVVLWLRNEQELDEWSGRLVAADIPLAEFREPDLDGQRTAIAFSGAAKRMVRRLPKAFPCLDH